MITGAVLHVDSVNANSMYREAMLRNIAILCPIIATYIRNYYFIPSPLFYNRSYGNSFKSVCSFLYLKYKQEADLKTHNY